MDELGNIRAVAAWPHRISQDSPAGPQRALRAGWAHSMVSPYIFTICSCIGVRLWSLPLTYPGSLQLFEV
jgi:hypothetical protein